MIPLFVCSTYLHTTTGSLPSILNLAAETMSASGIELGTTSSLGYVAHILSERERGRERGRDGERKDRQSINHKN